MKINKKMLIDYFLSVFYGCSSALFLFLGLDAYASGKYFFNYFLNPYILIPKTLPYHYLVYLVLCFSLSLLSFVMYWVYLSKQTERVKNE